MEPEEILDRMLIESSTRIVNEHRRIRDAASNPQLGPEEVMRFHYNTKQQRMISRHRTGTMYDRHGNSQPVWSTTKVPHQNWESYGFALPQHDELWVCRSYGIQYADSGESEILVVPVRRM